MNKPDQSQIPAPGSPAWNGVAGQAWVDAQSLLDSMFAPIEQHLVDATVERGATRILDVGCGTGSVTLSIARRLGVNSMSIGVDISEPMIAHARERAGESSPNAQFVTADAAEFAVDEPFELLVSRFGLMFFRDPAAAFANLRRQIRPNGGLVGIVWRGPDQNPFMTTAVKAARPLLPDLPAYDPDAPGQFGLSGRERTTRILEDAGWQNISLRPVEFNCGLPVQQLEDYVTRLGILGARWPELDEPMRATVLAAVLPAFAEFSDGREIRYTAACWEVSADAS